MDEILKIDELLLVKEQQKVEICLTQISRSIAQGLYEKKREFKFSFITYNHLPQMLDKLDEKCRNAKILSMRVFYPCSSGGDNLRCGCINNETGKWRMENVLVETVKCPGYVLISRTDTKL